MSEVRHVSTSRASIAAAPIGRTRFHKNAIDEPLSEDVPSQGIDHYVVAEICVALLSGRQRLTLVRVLEGCFTLGLLLHELSWRESAGF